MELVEFPLEDGGTVLVEVTESPYESAVSRSEDIFTRVGISFDQAIGRVRDAAVAAVGQFQQMSQRPDELEITFGVKLDSQFGAVIARTGLEGHLEIKLTWRRETAEPASD